MRGKVLLERRSILTLNIELPRWTLDVGHWTFYLGVGVGDGVGRGPRPNSSGFGNTEVEL